MSSAPDSLLDDAVALARCWLATAQEEPARASRSTRRLTDLVADPDGLDLAIRFVDRVARPEDDRVAARELAELRGPVRSARAFLGPLDQSLLQAGAVLAPALPGVVVPAARARLRQLVGDLVADAGPDLACHVARLRAEGFRANINLLGEAVLGEHEAEDRVRRLRELIQRPDIDYVSIKTTAVVSQLSAWDTADAVHRITATVRPLYLCAARHDTFLTLDMEEYHDLAPTLGVFLRLMADPELAASPMGVALQAYLPDASAALDTVTRAATRRRAEGGAAVKVRLVKGANLAMERVDAELHGWAQAPYLTKADTDAHYVRLLDHALSPERTRSVRIGLASHNLFDVALGHLLARRRGVRSGLDVEMLQGMAPAQARAVRDTIGPLVLYTPTVAGQDFDTAVSYLVRRLEENAAGENFLHALTSAPQAMAGQERAFREAVAAAATVATTPRRTPRPAPAPPPPRPFANSPDTDPALAANREWARRIVCPATARELLADLPPTQAVGTADEAHAVVARAVGQVPGWGRTTPAQRWEVLRTASRLLEDARTDLVATMVHEAHKTVAEADPEVSEAVDFAAYYAEQALALDSVPGAVFSPEGVTLVTPPWNFPVSIPLGSVLASLAAGAPVVIKPSRLTPRCTEVGIRAVRAALAAHGHDPDVVQVVRALDDDAGRALVTDPRVTRVLLTGSLETAQRFARWRPELAVLAETSGKNAIIVTPAADIDLAVADVVRSAFSHAGQKCSAASLLVLVGSAGRSRRLRRQLADAVTSLAVGQATRLATTMGPLTGPPSDKLLHALTTLEAGEQWLVRPRRVPSLVPGDAENLWTPGVKVGVRPGSAFHLTEVFGPVLGVMRADTLDEAIDLANAVPFGLTSGLQSLDEQEIAHWTDRIEVGNAYVNRHITGAIVGRQPFGGWKASVVGPGAKAGGPGYVAQLGAWHDDGDVPDRESAPRAWLAWALADDARCWSALREGRELAGLRAESNVLRYRPLPTVTVREGAGALAVEVDRVLAAATRVGTSVTMSRASAEDDATFAARVADGTVTGRIRVVGSAPGLRAAAAERTGSVTVLDQPVVASGHRELLTMLREQVVSRTVHRFGHVPGADT
ncbi:proline dehydrogenase family protein [Sanguibacter suarezii]|uniref:proline dehydrogenase family protein n=1 Tax=Sanguibacter suarezii TaxID=60921 RepID=UPI000832F207|nr:proline dehydrogenase family protein [Sanguibacter suarezii]